MCLAEICLDTSNLLYACHILKSFPFYHMLFNLNIFILSWLTMTNVKAQLKSHITVRGGRLNAEEERTSRILASHVAYPTCVKGFIYLRMFVSNGVPRGMLRATCHLGVKAAYSTCKVITYTLI